MHLFKNNCRLLFKGYLCLLLCFASFASHSEIVVGVYNNNLTAINKGTLRAVFTMRLNRWENGQEITVLMLNQNSETHREFCVQKLGIFPYQLQRILDKRVFSGKSQAPINVSNMEEMIKKLLNTPGAIGYISEEFVNDIPKDINTF